MVRRCIGTFSAFFFFFWIPVPVRVGGIYREDAMLPEDPLDALGSFVHMKPCVAAKGLVRARLRMIPGTRIAKILQSLSMFPPLTANQAATSGLLLQSRSRGSGHPMMLRERQPVEIGIVIGVDQSH